MSPLLHFTQTVFTCTLHCSYLSVRQFQAKMRIRCLNGRNWWNYTVLQDHSDSLTTNRSSIIDPELKKARGQPQLTLKALIVPRCISSHSLSQRVTKNRDFTSHFTDFTSCRRASWRSWCHISHVTSFADLSRGDISLQQHLFSSAM